MTSALRPVLALVVIGAACRPNAERERVDFERMRRQQRYAPYQEAPMFRDGMAMRVPPAQTLSHEEFVAGPDVTSGRRGDAALSAVPLTVTPEVTASGERLFGVYCAVCHAVRGAGGSGTVVGRNMTPVPPPLVGDSAHAFTAGQQFALITSGRGRMPAYAWAIPPSDRWAIVAYLRSLQGVEP